MTAPAETAPEHSEAISFFGKVALLVATALALLATPMVSPAMRDISVAFAGQVDTDPTARFLLALLGGVSDDVGIRFLIKFILLSTPALFIVLFSPITGWLSDRWGRRKLLIWALVLFGVSGISGYFVTTLTQLFIGRALLGVSVAAIKTLTVAMVGDYFAGEARNKFIGWQGSAMKVGGVVFLLLGGFLADIHWRVPFWGYALAFVALPGVILSLHDVVKRHSGAPGGAAQPPLADPIPVRRVAYVLISAFIASVLFFMTLVQIPFFIPERFDGTPGQIGLATALANTAGALIALVFYRFKAKMSFVAIFAFIFLMIGIGYAIVVVSPSYLMLLVAMGIAGCGFGLIVPTQSAWMLAEVSSARRGLGIGLVTTAMFLGQFASPIVIEPFILPGDPGHVFAVASGTLIALAAIYAAIAVLAGRRAATA